MQKDNTKTALLVVGGLLATSEVIAAFSKPGGGSGIPGAEGYEGEDEPQEPTLTAQRMAMLAEVIEEALLADYTEDEESAMNAILECGNNADVIGLNYAFGERSSWAFIDYTLTGAVEAFLSDEDIKELNDCLLAKGITYTFH